MQRRSSHFHACSHERSANSLANCSKQGRWLIGMGDCIRRAALMSDATLPAASDPHANLNTARLPSLFLTRWQEAASKLYNSLFERHVLLIPARSLRQINDTSWWNINMKSSCRVKECGVPTPQMGCKNQGMISVGAAGDNRAWLRDRG